MVTGKICLVFVSSFVLSLLSDSAHTTPVNVQYTTPFYQNHITLTAKKTTYRKKYKKSKRRYGFPQQRRATGNRVFIFDPRLHSWAAYNASGKLVRKGRASGGKHYCHDVKRRCLTPRGNFRVYHKGARSCKSSKYPLSKGGAPMPHCMFFYRGYAIHGSPNVPNYNASHGCIRVLPSAAAWLHSNFIRIGTTVIVRPY